MDKIEQLLVRACKSKNSLVRLESVYCRFYLLGKEGNKEYMYSCLVSILSDIVDNNLNLKTIKLFSALHPEKQWHYGIQEEDSYYLKCLKILISEISLTESTRFSGLQTPLRFKNKTKKSKEFS